MNFSCEIKMNNQAFDEPGAERILPTIYNAICHGITEGTIRDINGNKVGSWEVGKCFI